ncbi:hypothetical protein HY621_01440 [Candidatus Uhrbacteria bacterium]|nr:hypothetical protein [Candidatus Uhrbacteria bacterium]
MNRIITFIFLTLFFAAGSFIEGASAQKNIKDIVVGEGSAWRTFLKAFQITDPNKVRHPADIIVGILNIILGFLGLFMVCLLVYAGFLYMTAGGDEKQTTAAKGYIKNSIIGIAIVLASFAVTWFVTNALSGVIWGNRGV